MINANPTLISREVKIMSNTLLRFELIFTSDANPDVKINTFTWGETRAAAYARVVQTIEDQPDVWRGYSFTLADHPTANVVNRGAW